MGFLDRFLPKKDAPDGAPLDPNTPPASTGDEATRLLSNVTKTVSDSARSFVEGAKPLGEQLKPIGQSIATEVSNASRDLGGAIRGLSGTPASTGAASTGAATTVPVAAAPTDNSTEIAPTPVTTNAPPNSRDVPSVPVSDAGTPVSVSAASDLTEAEVAQAVEAAPPTKLDDALPLPDSFDPFCEPLETISPDATTSETRAHEIRLRPNQLQSQRPQFFPTCWTTKAISKSIKNHSLNSRRRLCLSARASRLIRARESQRRSL